MDEAIACEFSGPKDSSPVQISTAIIEALNQLRVLRRVLKDAPRAKRELQRLAGNPPGIDEALDAIVSGYSLTAADHRAIFDLVRPDPEGDGFVDKLARIDPAHPDLDALYDAYLTQTFTARKTLLRKATAVLIPDVAQ